jgi:hypothetical protein
MKILKLQKKQADFHVNVSIKTKMINTGMGSLPD